MPIPPPRTIRAKLTLVMVFILAAFAVALMAIGMTMHARHTELQIERCRSRVDYQTETVQTAVKALQDGVRELAVAGGVLYASQTAVDSLPGRRMLSSSLRINKQAVGGGIWFEPYMFGPDHELACHYAFSNNGSIGFDESLTSTGYHYPTQDWYVDIKSQLQKNAGIAGLDIVWTPPYVDEVGTHALMTTLGAGIYDAGGRFVGMVTLDIALDDIAKRVGALKPTPGSFSMFADIGDDYILALTDPSLGEKTLGKSLSFASWFSPDAPREREMQYKGKKYLSFYRALESGLVVVVNVPKNELLRDVNTMMFIGVAALSVTIVLIVVFTWMMLNKLVNRPVSYLSRTAVQIGSGNLDAKINLNSNDELGDLAAAFNLMTGNLKEHICHLNAVTADRERLTAQLTIARDIQAAMLPSVFPPFPDRGEMDLFACMLPAREVGGDFYDFFLIDDTHLGVVIADVSDKGIPAALFMVIAKTLIRTNAQAGLQPGDILAAANVQLCENNGAGMFVTAMLGILDLQDGSFSYANAGHNPPFIRRKNGTFEALAMPKGLVLAALEGAVYPTAQTVLGQGDALFLYTDGVTEAESTGGAFFGEARLCATLDALTAFLPGDLQGFLAGVKTKLDAFAEGAEQHDDITMLVLVFAGANNAAPQAAETHERSFRAATDVLPEFLAFIEERLGPGGYSKKQQLRFALAAEELFVNIAHYAYATDPDATGPDAADPDATDPDVSGAGAVDVVLRMFEDPARAELQLADSGKPFNPLAMSEPDLTLPAQEREIGGLGVFLAGKNTDEMRYERRNGRNVLTLTVFRKEV